MRLFHWDSLKSLPELLKLQTPDAAQHAARIRYMERNVALAQTPFYLESGGQVSDQGWLHAGDRRSRVSGVVRLGPGLPRAHRIENAAAPIKVRDLVNADVDVELRDATRRNHTATHLANWALREVLGEGVQQKGSLVDPDKLRFDFSHGRAVTEDEIARVESLVNERIEQKLTVYAEVAPQEQALRINSLRAVCGEK